MIAAMKMASRRHPQRPSNKKLILQLLMNLTRLSNRPNTAKVSCSNSQLWELNELFPGGIPVNPEPKDLTLGKCYNLALTEDFDIAELLQAYHAAAIPAEIREMADYAVFLLPAIWAEPIGEVA